MDAVRPVNRRKICQGLCKHLSSSLRLLTQRCPEAERSPWGSITNTLILCLCFPLNIHYMTQLEPNWKNGVSGSQPYWRGAAKHSSRCQGFSKAWQCQDEQQVSHKEHIPLHPQQAPLPQEPVTSAILEQGTLEEFCPGTSHCC